MVEIAIGSVTVAGDIGGAGISRFHWQRQDATTPTVPDCNAWGAAVKAFWQAFSINIPTDQTWTVQPAVTLVEHDTGAIFGLLNMTTVPGNVGGSGSGSYAAGIGCRVNWTSGSVHNRRLMRSATYVVPLAANSFSANGAINAAIVTEAQNAAAAYIAALSAAALEPIVWGRPKKGTFTGGHVGLITGAKVGTTPAGLRSRRS